MFYLVCVKLLRIAMNRWLAIPLVLSLRFIVMTGCHQRMHVYRARLKNRIFLVPRKLPSLKQHLWCSSYVSILHVIPNISPKAQHYE